MSNTNRADTTDPIPPTSIQPVARWGGPGPIPAQGNNVYPNWGDNTTWGYSSYLDNKSNGPVTYTFGKNFDDNAFLVIDGVSVINNTTWNQNVTGSITLAPGLHTVDLRFGQGSGGVGPNTGAYNNFGVAYNTVGNTATTRHVAPDGRRRSQHAVLRRRRGRAGFVAGDVRQHHAGPERCERGPGGPGLAGRCVRIADGPPGAPGRQHAGTGLDNSSTTFSGAISGGGSLIKQDPARLPWRAPTPTPAARWSTMAR